LGCTFPINEATGFESGPVATLDARDLINTVSASGSQEPEAL